MSRVPLMVQYWIVYTKVAFNRFRWHATLENKTPAETFPKFPSVLRVIDRSDWNPPITATSVTFWPSLRHAARAVIGWFLSDMSITSTDGNVGNVSTGVSFPKSRINENVGNFGLISLQCSLNLPTPCTPIFLINRQKISPGICKAVPLCLQNNGKEEKYFWLHIQIYYPVWLCCPFPQL